MYQSPIEVILGQMRTEFEDDICKAVQDYGITVDRKELIKALKYDRGQYDKGYSDGFSEAKGEVAREIIAEIEEGMKAAFSALQFDNNPIHRKVKYEAYSSFVRFVKTIEKKYTEENV